MAKHYNGKHTDCDHDSKFKPRYVVIHDDETVAHFTQILDYYAQQAVHFKAGRLCNTVESVNRMIVSYTSKNIDERKNYPIGANLAVLRKNEGYSPSLNILKDLGLSVQSQTEHNIEKKSKQ